MGSSRCGSLLEPSAPTWAQVWPRVGLANRTSASSAKAARVQGVGERRRLERVGHAFPHEPRDGGIGHGGGDGRMPSQEAAVGDGRVRAVEEPQLAPFERADILHELHADVGEKRQAILRTEDPRAMAFGADGGTVDQAEGVGNVHQVVLGRGRHHAVDDRIGEGDLPGDPCRQGRRHAFGRLEDAGAKHVTVVEQIVERGDDRWCHPVAAAPSQSHE